MEIVIRYFDTEVDMHEKIAEDKIEIDVLDADGWVERIGRTAYEMCNNNNHARGKL
jgi:hypothetical protein